MKCSGLNSKFAHIFFDMNDSVFQVSGQIVDVINSRIFKGTIFVENGKIINIIEDDNYEVIQEFTTIGKVDKDNPRTEIEIEEVK